MKLDKNILNIITRRKNILIDNYKSILNDDEHNGFRLEDRDIFEFIYDSYLYDLLPENLTEYEYDLAYFYMCDLIVNELGLKSIWK